jgi:hypothetical protein
VVELLGTLMRRRPTEEWPAGTARPLKRRRAGADTWRS